jgi:hypothetical protein
MCKGNSSYKSLTQKHRWLIILLIIISLLLLGIARKALSIKTVQADISTSTPQSVSQTPVSTLEPLSIKERIAKDFSPHMAKVVECESHFRQFDSDGTVLLSPTLDVGIFQINLKAHLKQSQKMGLDIINSEEDNYKYAKYLFDLYGEKPWVCAGLI